jgi:membrane protein required for colicin V production
VTTADIVILIVILISLLLGLWRGFVKEAFSLASWVAAVLIAGFFSAPLADLMTGVLGNATARSVLASATLFILVMFVGALIGNIMSKLSAKIGLRGVDRTLGSLFGLLRGLIIVLLVLFLTVPFQFSENWYRDSVLVPRLLLVLKYVENMLDYQRPEPATEVEAGAVT